jgi:two-component system, OmpR family, alkaline phosphatase synthesis response regulator PhoP
MSKRILICDDEIHILRPVEFKFQRAGYEVETAADGQQGWLAVQARKPDILITDCQMPGMDGIELIRRVRQNAATADLPVLMLTGKGFELDRRELVGALGVAAIFTKPFSPRELLARVNAILMPTVVEPCLAEIT